ncbi:helix-turn-helix domain-containing protein, partial [Candidatus Aerophobetes bacterium]|nr:helix-turn-helix domain-containing protein [Candidatus Aerophobetes bacterium]
SVHTIYKMAQKRKIPALKAGKKWRFRKEDIDRWLEKDK